VCVRESLLFALKLH